VSAWHGGRWWRSDLFITFFENAVAIKVILSSGDERKDWVRKSYGGDCVELEMIRDRMDASVTRRDSTKGSLLYQPRKRDTRMKIPPRNNALNTKSSGMLKPSWGLKRGLTVTAQPDNRRASAGGR
jgi:hypothetical protein